MISNKNAYEKGKCLLRKLRSYTYGLVKMKLCRDFLSFQEDATSFTALKLQIKFHNKVLNQIPPDKSVLPFSYKGKQHNVDKLIENLFQLLDKSHISDNDQDDDISLLQK